MSHIAVNKNAVRDVELIRSDQVASFSWPQGSDEVRAFVEPMVANGVGRYIRNVQTTFCLLRVGSHVFPATTNTENYESSYVCSPYNGAITYTLEELRNIQSRLLRGSLAGLIHSVAPLLRAARINQTVCVNNWLISTNLYPEWNGDLLREATRLLLEEFPDRAILFRSLNRRTNDALCDRFIEENYSLAPTRQVYWFDGSAPRYLQRRNCRWDQRLLEETEYEIVSHDQLVDVDDARIGALYDKLYLDKYSLHNPQFTTELIRLWRTRRLLEMYALRSPAGRIDGAVGLFSRGGVLTGPLVGYDTELPQKLGLYRMLMAIVLREAANQGVMLNLSSGAADFKRVRGATAEIEYMAVYCDHLPRFRRAVWKTLAMLLDRIGTTMLRKYQL